MRIYLTAGVLIGMLAGCSSDQAPVAGKAAVAAGESLAGAMQSSPAFRAPMSGFASLPDRGELLAYEQVRQIKHKGAYTAYPVAISETHALRAMHTGEMVVNAPNGEPIRLKYERHEESPDGNWTWIGRNADGASAVITFGEKAVFGVIPQGPAETLRLTMSAGQSWLVQTDRSKLAGRDGATVREGGDQPVPPKLAGSGPVSMASMRAEPTTAGASASSAVVDILLGYTSGYASQLGSQSAAVSRLVNMTAITNDAYEKSGVNMRVRLVKTLQVNYPDNTDNGDALESLTGYRAGDDGGPIDVDPAFKALREARDETGADLVSLVRAFRTPENAGCGIAWLIGGGETGIVQADEPFGYSVVSDGTDLDEEDDNTYFCREETLAHELGHNMGQAHNEDDSSTTGVHAYSYGYRETSSSGFYTVMAYPQTDGDQFSIRYFANPSVKFSGRATGVANKADNVRSMNQVMRTVAQFRDTVIPVQGLRPDLYVIKRNGSSSKTEVHILGESSGYKTFTQHAATALAMTGAGNDWAFLSGDYNNDGKIDLYVVKRNGASRTEVHVLNGADKFRTYLLHASTVLAKAGSSYSWDFKLGDYNGDGKIDLYAIKRQGSSGKTEVHVLDGANKFKSYLVHAATALHNTGSGRDWKFAVGDANSDGKPDLYVIKRNGSSGKTEVHVLNGANKYRSFLMNKATPLANTGTGNNWEFVLGDYNEDGVLDLYAIKKTGSSGKTEVHVINGADGFGSYLKHTATGLAATGTSNAWQFTTP